MNRLSLLTKPYRGASRTRMGSLDMRHLHNKRYEVLSLVLSELASQITNFVYLGVKVYCRISTESLWHGFL